MRFLFLSNEFPNRFEPTKATFNADLIRGLSELDHTLQVVAPVSWVDELRGWSRAEANFTCPGLDSDRVSVSHPRFLYTPGIWRQHYDLFLKWSLVSHRSLWKDPLDCVLSYWAHPDGAVAAQVARNRNVPCVTMVGGSDILIATRKSARRKQILHALHAATAIIAVSRDLKSKMVELGIDADKIHVFGRGVDGRHFFRGNRQTARGILGIETTGPVLLWAGRMVGVKGVDTLISALAQLRARIPTFQAYLVGDGPDRARLEASVRRSGLERQVCFAGVQAHAGLGNWMRAADLFVLPSLSEGVPNVLLESLACGTPYVASCVGGIPEISQHAAAQLVPPRSPRRLAEAMESALRNPQAVPESAVPPSLDCFAGKVANLALGLCRRQKEIASSVAFSPAS